MFKIKLSSSSSSSSSSFSLKIILIKINDDDDFSIFMHLQCKLTFLPYILELSTIKLQNYFMIFSKTAIKCHKGNAMKQKSENLLRQISEVTVHKTCFNVQCTCMFRFFQDTFQV